MPAEKSAHSKTSDEPSRFAPTSAPAVKPIPAYSDPPVSDRPLTGAAALTEVQRIIENRLAGAGIRATGDTLTDLRTALRL